MGVTRAIQRLDTLLRAALPGVYQGCAVLRPDRVAEPHWFVISRPSGHRIRVDLAEGSTQQHRDTATTAVLAADLTERRPRALSAILAQIQALTQQQQFRLFQQLAAEALVSNPALARRAGFAFDGDEPAT